MQLPLSTGQAAEYLRSTEPRLAELVRHGRIHPPPNIRAGRRLWDREHLLQAARILDVSDPQVLEDLTAAPSTAPTPTGSTLQEVPHAS